ncbi:MAG: hypothetical protein VKN72_10880 [Nostocales cyanobacterium 94392]|nr:hypothetical protein [Nostocales cyanobacterium 94392]
MLSNFRKTFVLVAVVASLSTGCKYSKEYQQLTEASSKYTTAVDGLLIKAGELQVESTSENILSDDRLLNQTVPNYREKSNEDKEMLQVINDIRSHNRLLQKYFSKLNELAQSKAPEDTQKEIDGIATNLQTISSSLKNSSFFPKPGILQGIGNLAIHSKINGALRKELEKRDRVILQELTIQQELLKNLSGFMKNKVEMKRLAQEQRFVIRPLIDTEPVENEESWIEKRNEIFAIDTRVEEIENASVALGEFKTVFEDSVEGKITGVRLKNALKDIDSFLALLENKQQTNQEDNQQNATN